jgi:ABC-type branched-subunit amino acid transport system substrate-binding protein
MEAPLAQSRKRLRVGVIAGLTGLAAPAGISVKRGVEMADAAIDTDDHVEFIFEDDGFQAKNAVSAAQKLISEGGIDALITFSGSTSLAVSTVAEARRVPMIAITPLTSVSSAKSYVSTVYVPHQTSIEILKDAIKAQVDGGRVVMLTSTQDALLQIRQQLRVALGTQLVYDEELQPGDVDLLSTVTRMLASKPDVVVNLTLPPQTALVAKILRDRRYRGGLFGAPPMYNMSEIKAANGALAGAQLVGPQIDHSTPFLRDYEARFGEECLPEGIFGYDAATWVIAAGQSGQGLEMLRHSTSQRGLAGMYPKNGDNQYQVPGELKVITSAGEVVPAT